MTFEAPARPVSPLAAVAPFLAMDVLREAAALERQGRRIIHMEVGEPGRHRRERFGEAAISALAGGRIGYTEALGLPACAPRSRATIGDALWGRGLAGADRGDDGLVGRLHPGVSGAVSTPAPGSRSRRRAIPPIATSLEALGLEPVALPSLGCDALCRDGRDDRGRTSPTPPRRRAADEPGQSVRHDDDARGARRHLRPPATGSASRFISDEIYHGLTYERAGGYGARLLGTGHRRQLVLEILLHDRMAGRLAGSAGRTCPSCRAAAADPCRSRCRC